VIAMAHRQLGHETEARAALARCHRIAAEKLPRPGTADLGSSWVDWIIAHALMREAAALIQERSAPARETTHEFQPTREAPD
jgi:hypothetical protein